MEKQPANAAAKRFAYVTAITTDDYLLGVLTLKVSLKMSGARYDLIAVVSDNVAPRTEEILQSSGIGTIRVPKIALSKVIHELNCRGVRPHWNYSFGKLAIFSLIGFDKLVYVDSDMLILRNLDELFSKPHMSAVVAGRSFPGNEHWRRLNSGLMVVEPQAGLYKALVDCIPTAKTNTGLGDQDVLQFYYNWPQDDELILDESYNIFVHYVDYYLKNRNKILRGKKIKVVHFVGAEKPWAKTALMQLKHVVWLIMCRKKYEALFFTIYVFIIHATRLRLRRRSFWNSRRGG